MRLSTLVKLAWAGNRADWFRLVFTAFGAALGTVVLLAAATVYWLPPTELITEIPGGLRIDRTGHRYTTSLLNDTVVRPWLAAALLLLTLPALILAGQSSRLGAPARDRRLTAIRLAGATPGQTRLISVIEATAGCLAGAVLGIGCFFLIRALAHRPVLSDLLAEEMGLPPRNLTPHLPLPTDALPPLWVFPAVGIAVPLAAAVLSAIALRRMTVTPLTVSRRARNRKLRWWPLALVAIGFAILPVHYIIDAQEIGDQTVLLPLTAWSAVLSLTFGVALCAAPLGQIVARSVQRYARRPAPLLAARWITADPWSGSRSLAVLLISVLAATAAIRGTAYFKAGDMSGGITELGVHRFSLFVLVLTLLTGAAGLLFAIVEGILTRRRALVNLVAAGTPKGVLARAVMWQALMPALPAVVLAAVVGVTAVATSETQGILPIGAGLPEVALVGGGAVIAVTAAAALSVIVQRASTQIGELRTE